MGGMGEEQLQTNNLRFFYLFRQPKTIVGKKTRGLGISSLNIGTFLIYIVLALNFYFSSDRLF